MAGEENHLEMIKLSSFKKSRNLVGKSLEEHKLKNVLPTVANLSTDKRGLCEENEPEPVSGRQIGPIKPGRAGSWGGSGGWWPGRRSESSCARVAHGGVQESICQQDAWPRGEVGKSLSVSMCSIPSVKRP